MRKRWNTLRTRLLKRAKVKPLIILKTAYLSSFNNNHFKNIKLVFKKVGMTRLIEKHVVWQYSQPARKNIPSGISATTSQQICLCDKCTLYSDQKRGEFSASIINNFQDTLNSQINTPAVTPSKLAVAYQNNVLSFTFMSLTVEPSFTLENTFVPCLSYWRFHPSTLSASRRKCSKSSALAARTSPTCIERP